MNGSTNVEQINVKRLFDILIDKIVYIIVFTLIGGLIAFALGEYFVPPKYESEISMIIDNRKSTTVVDSQYQESKTLTSDIQASQQLVPTYVEMIKSNNILEEVAEEIEEVTGEKFTVGALRSYITAYAVSDTEILKVKVRMTDAAMASEIADTISKVAPGKIQHFIERSDVKIIDKAKRSTNPVFPDVRVFTICGCIIGLLLSMAFFLLYEMFDVRVKSSEDLVSKFGYPVLGTIPEIFVGFDEEQLVSADKNTEKAKA